MQVSGIQSVADVTSNSSPFAEKSKPFQAIEQSNALKMLPGMSGIVNNVMKTAVEAKKKI